MGKNENADIIIIGGGAAGMMAAVGAAKVMNGKGSVIILEKMPRPGRKIMITGKGRCNLTNVKSWTDFAEHVHPKANILKPSFMNLPPEKLMDFFMLHGMETIVERGDRAFPSSHLASDVVDTLIKACGKYGTRLICNTEVSDIIIEGNEGSSREGTRFRIVCSDGNSYECNSLIIATGGLSYPKTGSTGDGYRWAEESGHKVRPCFPSLTALVPNNYKIIETGKGKGHIDRNTPLSETGAALDGNQLKNINLTVNIDGTPVQTEFGDIDFTDGGLEGPLGFKVSRRCVNAIINGSKVSVSIDLKPAVDSEDLERRIKSMWENLLKDKRVKRNTNLKTDNRLRIILPKLMPGSLVEGFLKSNPEVSIKTLGRRLKDWKFDICGYVGYERCVITAGGISCEEINPKTLESKHRPGLYFAGEILDIDCDTGGYNLQTAFCTGYLAGESAGKALL